MSDPSSAVDTVTEELPAHVSQVMEEQPAVDTVMQKQTAHVVPNAADTQGSMSMEECEACNNCKVSRSRFIFKKLDFKFNSSTKNPTKTMESAPTQKLEEEDKV